VPPSTCVRFLKEDPWERLRKLRRALPNSRLQMLLRGQNLLGYRHYPTTWCAPSCRNRPTTASMSSASSTHSMTCAICDGHRGGQRRRQARPGHAQLHRQPGAHHQQFVNHGPQLEAMGCHSIAIKDMAGLLTPQAATVRTGVCLRQGGRCADFLHSHATSGLASMSQLKAWRRVRPISTPASPPSPRGQPPHHREHEGRTAGHCVRHRAGSGKAGGGGRIFPPEVRKKYWQFESGVSGGHPRAAASGARRHDLQPGNQLKEQGAWTASTRCWRRFRGCALIWAIRPWSPPPRRSSAPRRCSM
jgi:pyruvate carboxylase subunit B